MGGPDFTPGTTDRISSPHSDHHASGKGCGRFIMHVLAILRTLQWTLARYLAGDFKLYVGRKVAELCQGPQIRIVADLGLAVFGILYYRGVSNSEQYHLAAPVQAA